MNPQDIKTTVKTFILNEYLPGEDPAALTDTTPLMTTGILDSIAILKVVTFLEGQFGITIQPHEAVVENLNTLSDIAATCNVKESLIRPPHKLVCHGYFTNQGFYRDRFCKKPDITTMATRTLHQLLDLSASRFPDKVAVEESESGSIRYDELALLSDRVRDRLREMGVKAGDRVGICAAKVRRRRRCNIRNHESGAAISRRIQLPPASAQRVYFS